MNRRVAKRSAGGLWMLLASLTGMTGSARGQEGVDHLERNLQQIQLGTQARVDQDLAKLPPDRRALIDYGGYLTFSYLAADDATHAKHAFRGYELVGYGRLNLDDANEFYARGRAEYRDYNPGDSFDGEPSHLQGRLEEAWYRFDLQRFVAASGGKAPPFDVTFKGGRQFAAWGNGLTLDQYVDGGSAEVRAGPVAVDLLACVTARETIDFDITRPHFFRDTHRGFFGARVSLPVGPHTTYAYFLAQRDLNRDEPADVHVIPTRYDYDSFYAGFGSGGALTDHLAYRTEFCFEGGHTLSNSFDPATERPLAQQTDRIEAYAANFRLDYLPNDFHRSRLSAEVLIASGDPDRVNTSGTFGGNRPGTADHAFNALGVLDTGLAFTPQVSNLMMLRVGASTYPLPQQGMFERLQTGVDLFVFGKTRRDAPIDEPTGDGHYLGFEPDVFVNWQLADDVILAVRYGIFFPGDAIPSGQSKHLRQFVYAGITYAF
jgi:hypothetical protein